MPTLDEIIDRMRDFAGADFAFILTRRGRLATQHAPENMPERGRLDLVAAAEQLLGTDNVAVKTMPREAIVPYGGAAPIDIYLAAREAAIMCVVMATWSDASSVKHAFERGLGEIDDLIGAEIQKRDKSEPSRRRRRTIAPPSKPAAKKAIWAGRLPRQTLQGLEEFIPPAPRAPKSSRPSAGSRRPTERPPPMRKMTPGRGTFPMVPGVAPPPTPPPAPPSAPDIQVSLSPIGRRTMAIIELDAQAPDITLGTASVGRATMAAIDMSLVPAGRGGGASMPDIRVELTSMPDIDPKSLDVADRQTLPFTEPAPDAKRTFDQHANAPDVRVRLAELDWDTRNAVETERTSELKRLELQKLEAQKAALEKAARDARREAEAVKRDSNIDAWHEALAELVTDDAKTTRRRPRTR